MRDVLLQHIPLSSTLLERGPRFSEFHLLDEQIRRIYENPEEAGHVRTEVPDAALSPETLQGHAYHKPYGYAGDFEMIDKIYTNHRTEREDLRRWDDFFQEQAAPKAVRNRARYLHDLLDRLHEKRSGPIRVLNVASGPGRDIARYFERTGTSRLSVDCIDQDGRAIEYAEKLCAPWSDRIRFTRRNAFRLRTEETYDLVWSAGLFDYLDDRQFVFLGRRLLDSVRPGGSLVLGNFTEENPSRGYMELFGEWFLNHRSPETLISLGGEISDDRDDCTVSVGFEPLGINAFLSLTTSA